MTIYCWDMDGPGGSRGAIFNPRGNATPVHWEPMPEAVYFGSIAFDAETGEEVSHVVRYDDERGMVERLLLDGSGSPVAGILREEVAKICEFRKLRFVPKQA